MPLARGPGQRSFWYEHERPLRTYRLTCGACGQNFEYTNVKRSREYYQRRQILCDDCDTRKREALFADHEAI